MKATISAAGMLIVKPETDLEAYALSHWSTANFKRDWYDVRSAEAHPVIVDCSGFDVRIPPAPGQQP